MMIGIFFIKATALENFCLRPLRKAHELIGIRAIEVKSNSYVNHKPSVWTLWTASPTISRQITHPPDQRIGSSVHLRLTTAVLM